MAHPVAADPATLTTDSRGVIRIAGTRITLDTVVFAYKKGDTPEQIAQDYSSLEAADIYATIAYYLRHRQEVEDYLERRQEESRAVRAKFKKRFPSDGLKERLQSRLR